MRLLGLILLLIGVLGVVLGLLHALGIPLTTGTHHYATWPGPGPIIAGLSMIAFGAYIALRRA